MKLAELVVMGVGGCVAACAGARQRGGSPSSSSPLVELSISDICNRGTQWLAPQGTQRQVREIEARYLDVEPAFEACLHRIESRRLPDERASALCLLEAAAWACEEGDDPWCLEALERASGTRYARASVAGGDAAEPGPRTSAAPRTLVQLRSDVHAEFTATRAFEDAMRALSIEFSDRTGIEVEQLALPVTAANLLERVRDSDDEGIALPGSSSSLDRFDWVAKAQGVTLGQVLVTLALDYVDSRPEYYPARLANEMTVWVRRHFPDDPALPLSDRQRRHLLGLLADHANGRPTPRGR